jgi:hypothetical protein
MSLLRDRVAERLEVLTTLGLLNSRIKDYSDLAILSSLYPFEGERLAEQSARLGSPSVLRRSCRTLQWRAFLCGAALKKKLVT